ncbi:MAG: hypothetical protein ACOYU0_00510 [Nitrospirota bacterium]
MPISVRLDKDTEELLGKASRMLKTTKSNLVKKSIKQYCKPIVEKEGIDHSEIIERLIKDCPGSNRGDLSIRHREIIHEMLLKKRRQGRL